MDIGQSQESSILELSWISGMLYIFDILSYLSCLVRSLLCKMSLLLTVLPIAMCGPIKGAFQGDSLFLLAFNPIIQSKPYSWYLSPLVWCSHLSLFATNLVGILSHECQVLPRTCRQVHPVASPLALATSCLGSLVLRLSAVGGW